MQVSMVTGTYTLVRSHRPPKFRWLTPIDVGYYVHTCQKMKYKGEYPPSYLLDPVRPTFPAFSLFC